MLVARSGSESLPGSRAVASLALLHMVTRGVGEFKPEDKSNISPSDLRKIWFRLVWCWIEEFPLLRAGVFACGTPVLWVCLAHLPTQHVPVSSCEQLSKV